MLLRSDAELSSPQNLLHWTDCLAQIYNKLKNKTTEKTTLHTHDYSVLLDGAGNGSWVSLCPSSLI